MFYPIQTTKQVLYVYVEFDWMEIENWSELYNKF